MYTENAMQLTTVVSVRGERTALLLMMRQFNTACNALSRIAFVEGIFAWLPLQRRAYYWLREEYGLTGVQATVAIRKVAAAYRKKARRESLAVFRPLGAIPVCAHRYKRDGTVLLYGMRCPVIARPGVMLSSKHQATLVYRDGRFFMHQVIDQPEAAPIAPSNFLGCDLGIVNILADSDGKTYAGGRLSGLRRRHARLRDRLQRKGTRSARRLLRQRRMREARFGRDINHGISKQVVAKALDTGRGIALEDLGGIRDRITVRKRQRRQHHAWSFFQLRSFIEYKARLSGVPVILVDPHNTSRTCPACGLVDKANRKTQAMFSCTSCGFAGPADVIAAGNISRRAVSLQPHAATLVG